MPIDHKLIRCEEDDPRRCKSNGGQGQCPFTAAEGAEYCVRHGANKQLAKIEQESMRLYRIAKFQNRLDELGDSPAAKGLKEEVAVLRMLLEETLNRCKDAEELFLMTNKISDLVTKIEKVVVSMVRLDNNTGQVLDKTAALNFASQILEIIGRYILETELLDRIATDILDALKSLSPLAKGA